jgi:hypothetical protein
MLSSYRRYFLYSIAPQLQRQPLFFVLTKLQLSVYSGKLGIQSMMKSNAKKLAEQDESVLKTSGIPYTVIRTGELQDTPGGQQGFTFDKVQITNFNFFFFYEQNKLILQRINALNDQNSRVC